VHFFNRKKKTGSIDTLQVVSNINTMFVPFGTNISKSDVVKICIDRIASQCAKLKPRYIKTENDKTVTEKEGRLSFLLKHKPNEIMSPYDFLYKAITLLMLDDNVFIYPKFDAVTSELKGLYPLRPLMAEMLTDELEHYYIKFIFEHGQSYILLYENIIHLRRHFAQNDLFGGNESHEEHEVHCPKNDK